MSHSVRYGLICIILKTTNVVITLDCLDRETKGNSTEDEKENIFIESPVDTIKVSCMDSLTERRDV